jgi:tRNA(Ile)-lysidine synthase
MMDLSKKFEQYWLQQKFPAKTQTILVAVSGGKDSMVLANLLLQSGYNFSVAHCNFKLRSEASDLDEKLVTDWAERNNIPLHKIAFDTQKAMNENKQGVQEAARNLRYNWFKELCANFQYDAIATAHHANDNAETLLINLCKGTGIAGLHGIPSRNGLIIRPLLFASRKEIEQYILERGIEFREDESNTGTKYLRNAVRHTLIPVLEEVFPAATERINESIGRLIQVESIYRKAIEQEKRKLLEHRGKDIYIPILKLNKIEELETICYEIFSAYGFSSAQIPEILKLRNTEAGHFISSGTHRIIKNRMFLIITELKTESTDFILIDKLPNKISLAEGTFEFVITENKQIENLDKNIASIDFDELVLPLILRRGRTGDYFYPIGMGMKKKKLSRFLIDQKIAMHQKEKIWILAQDQKIIWVSGMRMDERFKVKNTTARTLQIKFIPD